MLRLALNNYDFKKFLFERYNIHIKISKISEVKKFLREYSQRIILDLVAENRISAVNELFLFPTSNEFRIEPIELKESFLDSNHDYILSYLSQPQFAADDNFFNRNKNDIVLSFLYSRIRRNEGTYGDIFIDDIRFERNSYFNRLLEFFDREKKSYQVYYNLITEDDITSLEFDDDFISLFRDMFSFDNLNLRLPFEGQFDYNRDFRLSFDGSTISFTKTPEKQNRSGLTKRISCSFNLENNRFNYTKEDMYSMNSRGTYYREFVNNYESRDYRENIESFETIYRNFESFLREDTDNKYISEFKDRAVKIFQYYEMEREFNQNQIQFIVNFLSRYL